MTGPLTPEGQGTIGLIAIGYGVAGIVIGAYLTARDSSKPPKKTPKDSDSTAPLLSTLPRYENRLDSNNCLVEKDPSDDEKPDPNTRPEKDKERS